MMPDVSEVFSDWTEMWKVQIVQTTVADFETSEAAFTLLPIEVNAQPVPPRELDNKPEGQRTWEWWTLRTTYHLKLDQIIESPDCKQFRVMTEGKWISAGGYYEAQVAQNPRLNS